jgi:hypothetical protein
MRHRLTTLTLVCATLALALPVPAGAATIHSEHRTEPGYKGTVYDYVDTRLVAAPGEKNAVSAEWAGGYLIVRDTGAELKPSGLCSALDANTARCAPGTQVNEVRLGDGDDSFTGRADAFSGYAYGEAGADAIEVEGRPSIALLDGGTGDDTLTAAGGWDSLVGGDGADRLRGGAGDDRLYGGAGDDELDAGAGNDDLNGLTGSDSFDGGEGFDRLSYESHADPVRVNLADPGLDGTSTERETIAGIESVEGGSGPDVLRGGAGSELLVGGRGDDRLAGGGGNDVLSGRAGNDRLAGEAGDDWLEDQFGSDRLNGGAGDDTLNFGAKLAPAGVDRATCAEGDDLVSEPPPLLFVPRDCERVTVPSGQLSPVYDGSKRYATFTFAHGGVPGAAGCATIKLGDPAGRLGRLEFSYRDGRPPKRLRVPLTVIGRRALAATDPVTIRVTVELHACGRGGSSRPLATGGFRAAF